MKRVNAPRAIKQRKASEAAVCPPGSVIVHFLEPVYRVPWWRSENEEDRTNVFTTAKVSFQREAIVIHQQTTAGIITRLLNWRDVKDMICVPLSAGQKPEPPE